MLEKIQEYINSGTNIFNPQAKIIANIDNVMEFLETKNTAPVLVEIDPSNACNHGCYFCISSINKSVSILGFPAPLVSFIPIPTKNFIKVSFPALYSATCSELSLRIF